MLCIKECDAYSTAMGGEFLRIKIGETVDWHDINSPLKEKQKSEIVYRNDRELTLIEIQDFKVSFIPLAEWRDRQIDKILEE